jgi:hypothetical protein
MTDDNNIVDDDNNTVDDNKWTSGDFTLISSDNVRFRVDSFYLYAPR